LNPNFKDYYIVTIIGFLVGWLALLLTVNIGVKIMPFFVIGFRSIKGAKLELPQVWYRRLLGRIGNFIIQILLLPGFKDAQCGFKCFTSEVVTKVFRISKIDGFGFDFEVLALAKNLGYKIKEAPVSWVDSQKSTVILKSYFLVLFEALKAKWWLWTKNYNL
jgi:dolichyl-phosphate beta-glucosyltransferase